LAVGPLAVERPAITDGLTTRHARPARARAVHIKSWRFIGRLLCFDRLLKEFLGAMLETTPASRRVDASTLVQLTRSECEAPFTAKAHNWSIANLSGNWPKYLRGLSCCSAK